MESGLITLNIRYLTKLYQNHTVKNLCQCIGTIYRFDSHIILHFVISKKASDTKIDSIKHICHPCVPLILEEKLIYMFTLMVNLYSHRIPNINMNVTTKCSD